MSGYIEEPTDCAAVRDDLGELALGLLSGRSRARALSHVASCAHCSAELEQLSTVADALLLLAPEIEPPVGFELRLAERLGEERVRRPRRARRVGAFAAAAVAAALLGFGVGSFVRPAPPPGSVTATNLASANLTSHGHVVGELLVSAGHPGWLFMSIESRAWSGTVTCEVTLSNGVVERIGLFHLSNGYGSWGAPLRAPAAEVRSARLVAPDGSLLASANLPL